MRGLEQEKGFSDRRHHNYWNIYPTVKPYYIYEDENPDSKPNKLTKALRKVAEDEAVAGRKMCHRMILCVFAVATIWATSLQICVAIVGTSIKAPSFSSVVKNCKYAWAVVQEQSDYYAECTERQVSICGENLDAAYVTETFRVSQNQRSNTALLTAYGNAVGNCSASVSLAKEAIAAWTSLGTAYDIPFQGNCSGTAHVCSTFVILFTM